MIRFCVRFVCFCRLLIEDYLMMAAIIVLIALASVLQHILSDAYEAIYVQNRVKAPDSDFFNHITARSRGLAATMVLLTVGLWLIKFNFMLLFFRISHKIQDYLNLWWIALVMVSICGAVSLGLIPYDCYVGNIMRIRVERAKQSKLEQAYKRYIVLIVSDVLSDLISKRCRPITTSTCANIHSYLLSYSYCMENRIALAQEVHPIGLLLVGFTITITIIRCSFFGHLFKSLSGTYEGPQAIDSVWSIFWWYIEYITCEFS